MSEPTNTHQTPPEPTNACSEPIGSTLARYGVPAGVIRNVNDWVAELFRLRDRELPRTITLTYMPHGLDGMSDHGRGCWTVVEDGRIQPALDARETLALVAAMLLGAKHPPLYNPLERESHQRRENRRLTEQVAELAKHGQAIDAQLQTQLNRWDSLPWGLVSKVADALGLGIDFAGENLEQVLRFAADAALSPQPKATSSAAFTLRLDPESVHQLRELMNDGGPGDLFAFEGEVLACELTNSNEVITTADYEPLLGHLNTSNRRMRFEFTPDQLDQAREQAKPRTTLVGADGEPVQLANPVTFTPQGKPIGRVVDFQMQLGEPPRAVVEMKLWGEGATLMQQIADAREKIRVATGQQPNVLLCTPEVAKKIAPHLADQIDAAMAEPTDGDAVDLDELAELLDECGHARTAVELDWWKPESRAAAYDWCIRWQHWQAPSTAIGWDELPAEQRRAWADAEPVAPWFLTGAPKPAEWDAAVDGNGSLAELIDLEAAAVAEHAGFGLEPLDEADLGGVATTNDEAFAEPLATIDRNALHLAMTRNGWTIRNDWLRNLPEADVLAISVAINTPGAAMPSIVQAHHDTMRGVLASVLASTPPAVLSGLPVAREDKGGDDIAASIV